MDVVVTQGWSNIPQQPDEEATMSNPKLPGGGTTSGGFPRYIIIRQQIWGLEQLPRAVTKKSHVTDQAILRTESPGRTKLDWHLDNASPVSRGPLSGGVFTIGRTWQEALCGLWRAHWLRVWRNAWNGMWWTWGSGDLGFEEILSCGMRYSHFHESSAR